jgi:putative secretion ATPase (PEP-CTERM system associated)
MYDSFYGFTARPFQLTPDPRFWFESATHRTAMSYLGYGLAQGEGFIVITGEVGSGKTTLVGHVMKSIDPSRLTAARLVSTQVADADLLRLVCDAFGIAPGSPAKSDALAAIETFLHEEARAGRRTLLIVDEAQNLDFSALEELRMLSNFQLGETSLLQIFLLAQPEFRATLASPQLEQLRQRVIATHHLEAMLPEEVEPYLIHRLSLVGWREDPVFSSSVYDELWRASAGIPRRINGIVNRLLLHGAVEERHELDGEDVRAVVDDMGLSREELSEPVSSFVAAPEVAAKPAPVATPAPAPAPVATTRPVEVEAPAVEPGFSVSDFRAPRAADFAPDPAPAPLAEPAPVGSFAEEGKKQKIAALTEQTELLKQQVSALEKRCDEQDAAIRRILGLLIDWVEQSDEAAATPRGRAA